MSTQRMSRFLQFVIACPILFMSLSSCQFSPQKENTCIQSPEIPTHTVAEIFIEPEEPFDVEKHLQDYTALKKRIRAKQNQFNSTPEPNSPSHNATAKSYFFHTLLDSVFPYWYGTPWDFNGYTEKPRQGKVACGYFVSTTLRDMGFKINRYKVAQKAALEILKTFTQKGGIHKFSQFDDMLAYLNSSKENEIFILGLDYHVGFVVRKDQSLYFIHANYFGNSQVEKEAIRQSYSAQSSVLFYLGSLTGNEDLLQKWRNKAGHL